MINLIPPHARKQVRIEYWVRVISVWVLLVTSAFVIIGLLLIPSLVLVRSQLQVYDGAYQTASDQNDVYKSLEKEVRDANNIAQQLMSTEGTPLFTELIEDVENIAKGKVTIQSISFQRNEQGIVEKINIMGNSESRVLLVAFRNAIEQHDAFSSAELPLSNLAKDKDIPFSIEIVVDNSVNN